MGFGANGLGVGTGEGFAVGEGGATIGLEICNTVAPVGEGTAAVDAGTL